MTHTHTLEFTLTLTSSDPLLDGSAAQLGAAVYGELYLDANAADLAPGETGPFYSDIYQGGIIGGLMTFDTSGGGGSIDAEVFLAQSSLHAFHSFGTSQLQFDFFAPDGEILGGGPFGYDPRAIGIWFNGPTPAGLEFNSMQALLDAGLDTYTGNDGFTSFIMSFDAGGEFPIASGSLESVSLFAVPAPGPLSLAGAAVFALALRRLRR